ncbi:MAG: anaerobic sulfatase-maturation protein [Prevotella sp.]|nr:anaerobic sulfatase-maturation protein [Prevotella sp.]
MLHPFARPLYVMLKPAGASCNLRCQYCYYLEKASLYPQSPMVMSDELLQTFIRQYIEAQTMPQVLFTWHGGEPLLRPLSFYRRALQLQKLYSRGRQIDNCLQTNGLLLTDEWCEFLAENQFLVGISIDGPENIHDHYRRDVAGQGTFARVMKAIRLLQKHGVEWNAMAVVTNNSMYHPQEFYRFFKDIGCQYLQFTPIVERERHRPWQLTDASVTTEGWGHFLCGVYDEWVRHDVGRIFVQLFDAVLSNWVGQQPGICSLSAMCGHVAAMEWNGDVYSCDHFVFPEYKLGNINTHSLTEMMYGQQQRHFSSMKTTLPRQCHECRYLTTCYGECPKNRFITDRYDNPGLNYLCNGYRQFFNHVASDMDFMAAELRAGRAPSNILLR